MNIRVKAALLTLGMLASSAIIFLAIGQIFSDLTTDQIQLVFGVGFIGFIVYCLYSITLNRLEYEARIKEIRDQK